MNEEPTAPSTAETHISTLFFTSDRAYKLLKPITTSFLDHSSVDLRKAAIDEEIRLNRRLAADVYLGTADVFENDRLVDRMIVMRRLPDSRRLTELMATPELRPCLRAIARRIASFHAAQEPRPDAVDLAGRDAVARNWADNFTDLKPLVGECISADEANRVERLAGDYLDHHRELFDLRLAEGFVRDGHGDLTAQDIFCLSDGPRILDCLAFDERLRIADVLADVAFLAMDLDRLAGAELAAEFIRWYRIFSNEHHPSSLAHHYVAYRAHVRAKVAGIRYRQGDLSAGFEVAEYHRLCLRHLERARLDLILVGGAPGTGKTSLSEALSGSLGAMMLSTDELRKDLTGLAHGESAAAPIDQGIYDPAVTARTYAELIKRGGQLLDRGESVILDASWASARHRAAAATLAKGHGARVIEIECQVDPETARERVAKRRVEGHDSSDALPSLVGPLRERRDPWPEARRVDTGGSTADTLSTALALLDSADEPSR